jgi:hypothetical protein
MTLVEQDIVTTWWARQENPPPPHFFFKLGGFTFLSNFESSFIGLYCLGNVQKIPVPETAFKFIFVAVGGGTAENVRRISKYIYEIPSSKPCRIIFKRSTKNVFIQ